MRGVGGGVGCAVPYSCYILFKYRRLELVHPRKIGQVPAEAPAEQTPPCSGPILPYRPDRTYADSGWVSWDDFVGEDLERQCVHPLTRSPAYPRVLP